MLNGFLDQVKDKNPLIHSITNAVTINDCANALLAFGAAPIMANSPLEASEITALSDGLYINLGMPGADTIEAMFLAGRKANEKGIPVVLDPVGVGASSYRQKTIRSLLDAICFTAIRGNHSEIMALAHGSGVCKGVESDVPGESSEYGLMDKIKLAKDFSRDSGALIILTGDVDVVANDKTAFVMRNGVPMMAKVTGCGCILSGLITAVLAANPYRRLEAVAACVSAMGICGETAYMKMQVSGTGNATYRNDLIDLIFNFTEAQLESGAHYDIR